MLSEFIYKLRKKNKLTQEYLASELGISRPTYVQIEQGKRDLTITEGEKLAGIFGISLSELISGNMPDHKVIIEEEDVPKKEGSLQIRVTRKDMDKFKQVLLYVLGKVGAKPNVGETVIHKLLYFIDFDYYEKFEENLMGLTYIKNQHGPTSIELGSAIEEMKDNKEVESVKSKYFTYEQKKYLPLIRPNLKLLLAREMEHIDEVLARLSDKNAKEIEAYSHEDIPFKTARDGEPLSYESVFYRDERYSVRNYEDEL